jgi:hypothetical protein
MKVQERQGEWDTDETLQLQSSKGPEAKAEVAMTTSLLEGVASGGAGLTEALAELTEETYFKIEVQLIKAAVTCGDEKVIDEVMALRERFSGSDDVIKHRRDFDWLLEAVTKVTTTNHLSFFNFILEQGGVCEVPSGETQPASQLPQQ